MTNKLELLAELLIRFLGRELSEEQRKAIDDFELSLERLAHKFAEDHLLFFEVVRRPEEPGGGGL